jgi:hypothetical protein
MPLSLEETINKVGDDLMALSPEEFASFIKEHENGDIAIALREMWAFAESEEFIAAVQ